MPRVIDALPAIPAPDDETDRPSRRAKGAPRAEKNIDAPLLDPVDARLQRLVRFAVSNEPLLKDGDTLAIALLTISAPPTALIFRRFLRGADAGHAEDRHDEDAAHETSALRTEPWQVQLLADTE